MSGSIARLLFAAVLATLPAHATAQVLLTDAISVVADPVTLSREVQADTTTPFQVHVVYTNPQFGSGSVSGLQFGLELDPGLSLLGATTSGLMITPAPMEYVLAFPDCLAQGGPEPFVALTAIILRSESAAPGAGIRLRGLDSSGEPARATHCGGTSQFAVIDFGGVIVNAAAPTVAGFASSPVPVVEGRSYNLGWMTTGGGTWSVDGSSVGPEGTLQFTAAGPASHELAGGASPVVHQIEVIREPQINFFTATPTEPPGTSRLNWDVAGAAQVDLTGMGQVPSRGSALVNTADFPMIELSAVNEWGSSFEVIEFTTPTGLPVILEFAAEPSEFSYGQQVALRYRVEGASELRVDPEPGRIPIGDGYVILFPTEAQTYTLTASNSLGTVTAEVVLTAPAPDIYAFRIEPEEFGPGEEIVLHWAVAGADSIWIEPDIVLEESSGDYPLFAPVEPTTYTLVAENGAGRATRDVTVTALPPRIDLTWVGRYTPGYPVNFTWYTWWAETLTLMPDSIPLVPNRTGELLLYPEGVQTWRWVATNAVGTTTATRTLSPARASIRSFEVEPNPGVVGQSFDFVWRIWGQPTGIAIEGVPGLVVPGFPYLYSGRVTHTFDEPYEGRPVLVVSSAGGVSRRWLAHDMDVRGSGNFIDFFHEWHPHYDTGEETPLHWVGRTGVDYEYEGTPVPWNGIRNETLSPGTHFRVLTATYLSVTQADTAWVTIDPIGSFEVDGAQSSPDEPHLTVLTGSDVTLTWNTPGATRVSISPDIGDVDVAGGQITIPVVATTDFVLSAWYDGEREVIERGVHVSLPLIDQFEVSSEFVRPDEPVTLRWKVRGADLVRLESSLGDEFDVAPEDSLTYAEPPYGYWVLRAYNNSGQEAEDVRIVAPYVEVNEFYAEPERIVLGEPVTLRWDVAEASEVEIIGVGTFPPQGEFELIPPDSRGYELVATGPTDTQYRVAPVRVDVDADRPAMIMVSAAPDRFVDGLQPVPQTFADGMPRYEAWVRIQDVLGSIRFVRYALEVPDWLEIERAQSVSLSALENSLTSHYWVRLDACETGEAQSEWITYVRLKQIAAPGPDDSRSIRIHPGMPDGSWPAAPVWESCGTDLEFDFSVPGMELSPGDPLTIITGPVPIRSLPLSSRWIAAGLELSWSDLPEVAFAELGLYRGSTPGDLALVASAGGTLTWTDAEASRLFDAGPLFYQLIGQTGDGGIWRSPEIEIHAAPSTSVARTRLVGARPNPFNPMTSIEFELQRTGPVQLTIYDLAGRRVREWSLANQSAGPGRVTWNGADRNGSRAASGVYIVRMQADGLVDTKRVTLLK